MTRSPASYQPGNGLPAALPPGSAVIPVSVHVSGTSEQSGTPNMVAFPPSPGRLGARQLARLSDTLSERDVELLRRIDQHHYLTTFHLQQFVFTEHHSDTSAARTTRRVLGRLSRLGLLRRLDRRVGGVRSGSAGTVWQLSPAAVRLVRGNGRARRDEPSLRFLAHCLSVADVHLAVLGLRHDDRVQQVEVAVEPACWRQYPGSGGEARWVQPDLSATVTTPGFVDRYVIEVDLGSESLPTLLRKCHGYEAYRANGREQHDHGVFPLVLWCFNDSERALRLEQAIGRAGRLTTGLHRFATFENLRTVLDGSLS